MGEDFDPLTTEEQVFPEISHRRILFEMAGVIIAGTLAGFAFFSAKAGMSVPSFPPEIHLRQYSGSRGSFATERSGTIEAR